MFGFRSFCIESAFFSTYYYQKFNITTISSDIIQISPVISPKYRLLLYLSPCIIPLLVNISRLWFTTKGLWKYLVKYPQFVISPCFIPFMFEGYQSANGNGQYKIRIWESGTLINAIYIGCFPQFILCITDYYKGVHQWEFGNDNLSIQDAENLMDFPLQTPIDGPLCSNQRCKECIVECT